MRPAVTWLACLSLGVAGVARALEVPAGEQPVRLDVTTTTVAAWHTDNRSVSSCDDYYAEGLERLNMAASRGEWVAGLRLDASLYPWKVQPRGGNPERGLQPCNAVELRDRYVNKLTPEKLWAGWNGRNLEVTLGDGYVSFGRGLALSLRKTDELGVDTTARGLRVRARTERFAGTLVGGITNINNVDEASGRYAADPNDAVAGAQVDAQVIDGLRVGAHAAVVAFHHPVSTYGNPDGSDDYQERWLLAGPSIEAPRLTRYGGFYLEGLVQRRFAADGSAQSGYGLYGTLNGHVGPATLLFEGKVYGDLDVVQPRFEALEFRQMQYATVPTVERVLQPLEHSQRNVRGGRLRLDWSFSPELTAYLNDGLFRDDEGYLDPSTVESKSGLIHDPYAGVDWHSGSTRVQGEVGVRLVVLRGADQPVRSDGHLDVSASVGLPGGSSIEAHWTHWERRKVLPLVEESWREGTAQVGYRLRPLFAVSAVLDYTTDKSQPSMLYPGGNAEWDFTASSSVRVFVGSSRGGLKCVSGVCRTFPPFSGAKAILVVRL